MVKVKLGHYREDDSIDNPLERERGTAPLENSS